MSARIDRLHELNGLKDDGRLELLPTKERMSMEAELAKLEYNLGGVRDMKRLPQAALIIDLKTEAIAVAEATRLSIPILGLVDSNVDPLGVAYPIPGNDDSMRSCEMVVGTIGSAVENAATDLPRGRGQAPRRGGGQAPGRGGGEAQARGGGARTQGGRGGRRRRPRRRRRPQAAAAGPLAGAAAAAAGSPRSRPGSSRRSRQPPQAARARRGLLMAVGAQDVKALRDRTGAAMMDCKSALEEAGGDLDKAVELLRVKGQASAEKRSGRATSEGTVASYIHAGGSPGVLVEVQCETDFVARNDDFQEFAREVAIHIAAAAPLYVSADEIPEDEREAERRVFEEKAKQEGKPDERGREDRRGPADEVGEGRRPARAGARALRPLRGQDDRAAARRARREDRREHPHRALRALRGRRGIGAVAG